MQVVYYHSGGLRLNPNLYANGKVCLSLLNTWSGSGCELWKPSKSTMLQVLVSIQALILNSKPYFNEPGFPRLANTKKGQESSIAYNRETFLSSCRTMLYSLRRPPKVYELHYTLTITYFTLFANSIIWCSTLRTLLLSIFATRELLFC